MNELEMVPTAPKPESPSDKLLKEQKSILLNYTSDDPRGNLVEKVPADELEVIVKSDDRNIKYESGFSIFRIMNAFQEIESSNSQPLESTDRAELQRVQNLIRTLVERYTNEARITFNISLQLEGMYVDREKGLSRLAEHNKERGVAHEALNQALKDYNKLLLRLQNKGYVIPDDAIVPSDIRFETNSDPRREALGEWAIETDYYLRAQNLLRLAQEKRRTQEGSVTETV